MVLFWIQTLIRYVLIKLLIFGFEQLIIWYISFIIWYFTRFVIQNLAKESYFILVKEQCPIAYIVEFFNPSRPNPRKREKNQVKFLFSHFFVVLQKVFRPS